jgi:putative ABC transport system ATP-binding protein
VARGITKVYASEHGTVYALRGIDLEVRKSEFVVMVGPSGSGKSSFLNIVGGLDSPTSGQLTYAENDLGSLSEKDRTIYRREVVGFVFQFYNLIPSLTAKENVELATDIAVDPLPAEKALEMVGLKHRLHHFPAQLSGGEQQRVAVARAIAKRPAILLCDEPTGALDSKTGIVVLEAIQSAAREIGATTILITHNSAIADMADRVVTFLDGRIGELRVNVSPKSPSSLQW